MCGVCGDHRHRSNSAARLNADKVDPTRTTVIRRKYEAALSARWRKVAKAIERVIVDEDGFAYERTGSLMANAQFDYPTSSEKVASFMRWLRKQQDKDILEITPGVKMENAAKKAWQNIYLRSSYQRGIQRSVSAMKKGGVKVSERWVDSAFFRPIHADRVGLIYTRAYSDLDGITKYMDTKISQVLAQGMAEGRAPKQIAKVLSETVKDIGINRSRRLVRTEVIRSHAEATLNTYEEAEMEGVEVQSEFATAGDNVVCPKCQKLEGKTFTMSEARGIIPVHPNCRCAWLPVVGDSSGKELF